MLTNLTEAEKRSISAGISATNDNEHSVMIKHVHSLLEEKNANANKTDVNRMLRSRVFEKVEDLLLSNYHLTGKDNFSEQDQILLRLKKRMLMARIISKTLTQNRMAPLKTILNIIIADSKKNEVYEVLTEALLLKKYF